MGRVSRGGSGGQGGKGGLLTMESRKECSAVNKGLAAMEQSEVAKIFGVSRARIQQIETRAIRKILEEIKREAAAAGVTPQQWMRGE